MHARNLKLKCLLALMSWVCLAAAPQQPTTAPSSARPVSDGSGRWLNCDFESLAAALRRDQPMLLDRVVSAQWPEQGLGCDAVEFDGVPLTIRAAWKVESKSPATQPGAFDRVVCTTAAQSRLVVALSRGPTSPESVPTRERLELAGARRANWKPSAIEMSQWTPLQLYEYVVSCRRLLAAEGSEDVYAEAVPLLMQFPECGRVTTRFEGEDLVGFLSVNPARRDKEAGARESARVNIFDRKSGEYKYGLVIEFRPTSTETDSIYTIVPLLLSGMH